MSKVANASKGVNCEGKEGNIVVQEGLEIGGIVNISGVGEFPAQGEQVSLGYGVSLGRFICTRGVGCLRHSDVNG